VISQAVDMNIRSGDDVTWTGSINHLDTVPEEPVTVGEWVMAQKNVIDELTSLESI
jgi:hypothetical protein